MRTLTVELQDRSYPIFIGPGLLQNIRLIQPYLKGPQAILITNDTVSQWYLKPTLNALKQLDLKQVDIHIIADGEQHKTLETFEQIQSALLKKGHHRNTTLIALGGGVTGDITGFAAACYQRGVNFIQIPTTLLAQVDSSVGGKTGVNHPLGKNMIGAFHQPTCVLIDTLALRTLPQRELAAGTAEIIKYGLIYSESFFIWLEENIEKLIALDPETVTEAIEQSCAIKAEIVGQDEQEQGLRAILNLGHTFGHAIETGLGFGQWLHGEAVALGLLMACDLSERIGWLDNSIGKRLKHLLQTLTLPTTLPKNLSTEQILSLMKLDKKVLNDSIRLVLLRSLGHAVVTEDFLTDQLIKTLNTFTTPTTLSS